MCHACVLVTNHVLGPPQCIPAITNMPRHSPTPRLSNHILPQPMSVHVPPSLLIARATLGLISMPCCLIQATYQSSSSSCVSARIHVPHARVHGVCRMSSQACILAAPEPSVHTCCQLPSMCHVPHLSSTSFAAYTETALTPMLQVHPCMCHTASCISGSVATARLRLTTLH